MQSRELKSYEVEVNGVRTTLRLTEEAARRRGLIREDTPAKAAPKAAKAPANKAAKPANKSAAPQVKSEE